MNSPVLTAFDRLAEYNDCSLVALRPAAGLARTEFDAELYRLRLAGVLTMSAVEGRHGVSQAELDAAVRENGEVLLFVHRR